jgi:tRNA 2-thiouridine synthesizing protein E
MTLQLNDKTIAVDKDGFLVNLGDWNRLVAEQLASHEQIVLTPQHWEIIDLLRQFYQQFELAPAMRPLIKFIGLQLGKEKANSLYLLQLFPGSPAKLAAKIAGLPKPDNCL